MMSLAIAEQIKTVMKNHVYCYNGKIYKQKSGGSIGNVLTGALATNFMLWWARMFKLKMTVATMNISEYKTYFLKYYVDDGNLALEAFPLGARFVNGIIIIDNDKIESDREIPDDRRTAEIVLEIANSVTDTIKLTISYPSNNEDG